MTPVECAFLYLDEITEDLIWFRYDNTVEKIDPSLTAYPSSILKERQSAQNNIKYCDPIKPDKKRILSSPNHWKKGSKHL